MSLDILPIPITGGILDASCFHGDRFCIEKRTIARWSGEDVPFLWEELMYELSEEQHKSIQDIIKEYIQEESSKNKAQLRRLWFLRNKGSTRSNTSAVTDDLLMTLPVPPTAATVINSLQQRRMADGKIC